MFQTHRVMKTLVRGATPVDLIPREVIMNPIWSAKELAGTDRYNETHIQDFVTKLKVKHRLLDICVSRTTLSHLLCLQFYIRSIRVEECRSF